MVATVTSSGAFRLNSALLKSLETQKFEIRLKKDGKVLAILRAGRQFLSVNKNGDVKNYNLTEKLEIAKIKLPAYYVFEYDAENQAFIGQYLAYNPNSKRGAEK